MNQPQSVYKGQKIPTDESVIRFMKKHSIGYNNDWQTMSSLNQEWWRKEYLSYKGITA